MRETGRSGHWIASVLAVCLLSNAGVAATFPSGGGDLASAEAWGGTLPGTAETIVLNKAGTYVSSGDVSFGQLQIATGGAVTLDMRGRNVTLNNKYSTTTIGAATSMGYGFAPRYDGNVDITLQGGFWNFANVNHFYAAESGKNDVGGSVTLTDGAIVTNVYQFMYGEHSISNSAIVDNAKVYAVALTSWATGNHNHFEIRNGGEMHLSSHFHSDGAGNPGVKTGFNVIRVTGLGSWLNVTGGESSSSILGRSHQGNELIVTDHARLDIASALKIGESTSGWTSNCTFTVENCATATVGTVELGAVKTNRHSRLNVLSDAVANIANLKVGVGGDTSYNMIVVSNATLNVSDSIVFPSAASSSSNELWIVDGAKLTGNGWTGNWGQYVGRSYGNRIHLRNATLETPCLRFGIEGTQYGGTGLFVTDGARLVNSDYCVIGSMTADNEATLSNAYWTAKGIYVGSSGVRNRLLITGSNAVFVATTSTGLVAGNEAVAMSNRLDILDGATVTMDNSAAPLIVGNSGSYNEGLVENSCVTCGYVHVGALAGACGNRLTLRNSTFAAMRSETETDYYNDPFGGGHDNAFTLDGTVWDLRMRYFRLGLSGSNNVMRLVNGGKLFVTNSTCSIGYSNANSRNNTLRVDAGSEFNLIRFRMMSVGSTLCVSNGTVNAGAYGINMGFRQADVNVFTTNCVLRLEGDAPSVTAVGTITFSCGARLDVALPRKAFAVGHVPLQAKEITFDKTSSVAVSGDEFFANTGGRVVLAEVSDSISLSSEAVAASLANMPAGCRLYVSGKRLIFSSPSRIGTTLIFR